MNKIQPAKILCFWSLVSIVSVSSIGKRNKNKKGNWTLLQKQKPVKVTVQLSLAIQKLALDRAKKTSEKATVWGMLTLITKAWRTQCSTPFYHILSAISTYLLFPKDVGGFLQVFFVCSFLFFLVVLPKED